MKKNQIIRAWKDEEYRLSLSEEERLQLPDSPVGLVELADSELHGVAAGTCGPHPSLTTVPCTNHTSWCGGPCFSC